MKWLFDTFEKIDWSKEDLLKDYERRKLQSNNVGQLKISTCWVDDFECYETAILDGEMAYPVERYFSEQEALQGHEKWMKKALTAKKVKQIGDGFFIPDEWVTLKRGKI